MPLHIALIHHPTVDKHGAPTATSVTNFDIHDLSRAGRTFGCEGIWMVHPYVPMQRFVREVMQHWTEGWGAAYNPSRRESLAVTEVASDLEEVALRISQMHGGRRPELVATSARQCPNTVTYETMRGWLHDPSNETPYCVLFGTGWGLHPSVFEEVDHVLEPIWGPTDWNHLSVRAAAGIILDRLMGRR